MSTATDVIKGSLGMSAFCVNSYLEDLTDEHLLIRPTPGANHIAWQLGHLISSEHSLINSVCPGSMPDLPEGFADRHTKETAGLDDASAFCTKDEYVNVMNAQRAGTLAALETISDEDLDKESPHDLREYCPTVASTFNLQALHYMMHSGQWVIVRRQLGREPLF